VSTNVISIAKERRKRKTKVDLLDQVDFPGFRKLNQRTIGLLKLLECAKSIPTPVDALQCFMGQYEEPTREQELQQTWEFARVLLRRLKQHGLFSGVER
jgi:hypothetical protein